MQYVIITGIAPRVVALNSYVEKIVYGAPERIYAVPVGRGRFVALVEYKDDQETWARSTYLRMSSFNLGSVYATKADAAWGEFGCWIGHYAGFTEAGTAV